MAKAAALSIYSMQIIIENLEWLIKGHVFLTKNIEKVDVIKARGKTKQILLDIRKAVENEIVRLGGEL